MPAVAIVTLVAVGLLVAVLAAYLIRVAFILGGVVRRLETILGAVAAVIEASAPLGEVLEEVNTDLAAARNALEQTAARAEISASQPTPHDRLDLGDRRRHGPLHDWRERF